MSRFKPVKFMGSIDEVFTLKTVPLLQNEQARVAVITNKTSISEPISFVLQSARLKFKSKAYLHWYSKFGVEEDIFE